VILTDQRMIMMDKKQIINDATQLKDRTTSGTQKN